MANPADDVRLIEGDCLSILPTLEAGSVDAVITDPPYGATRCDWDRPVPLTELWDAIRRVLKPSGVVAMTASQPFTASLVVSNAHWFRYEWIWDKANPSGHLNAGRRPLLRHESVLVFAPGAHTFNPQMRTGKMRIKGSRSLASDCYGKQRGSVKMSDQYHPTTILEFSNAHKAGRSHPTQKPVGLMAYLIRTYTNPGDTILDPFAGSGTTGVAAAKEGRKAVLIEREPAYCDIIRRRLAEANGAGGLFAEEVACG